MSIQTPKTYNEVRALVHDLNLTHQTNSFGSWKSFYKSSNDTMCSSCGDTISYKLSHILTYNHEWLCSICACNKGIITADPYANLDKKTSIQIPTTFEECNELTLELRKTHPTALDYMWCQVWNELGEYQCEKCSSVLSKKLPAVFHTGAVPSVPLCSTCALKNNIITANPFTDSEPSASSKSIECTCDIWNGCTCGAIDPYKEWWQRGNRGA